MSAPRVSFVRLLYTTAAHFLPLRFVMSSDSTSPTSTRRIATNRERATSRQRSESAEAREHRLARVRARRRERLASETAEERETRLSRERLRRAADLSRGKNTYLCQKKIFDLKK